jgi:hypothetical protein
VAAATGAEDRRALGGLRALAAWICHLRGGGAPVADARAGEVLPLAAGPLPAAAGRLLGFLDERLAADGEAVRAVLELCRGWGRPAGAVAARGDGRYRRGLRRGGRTAAAGYTPGVFCPACRAEFVDGVTTCPDDLVDLVAELPRKPAGRAPVRPELAGHGLLADEVVPQGSVPDFSPADAVPEGMVLVYEAPLRAGGGEPNPEFIRSVLEENGIDLYVAGEELTARGGVPGGLVGAVAIYVNPEDAELAGELIAEVAEGRPPPADGAEEGDEAGWDSGAAPPPDEAT